jgi:hypothetical protein
MIIMASALTAAAGFAQEKPAAPATAPAAPAQSAKPADADPDPVIITAGKIQVRKSEFENAVKTLPEQYQGYAMGPGKRQFADDYLRMKMLAVEGMNAGLQNDPQVQEQLNLMKENLVANAELQKIEKDVKVSDAEIQKYYDDHKSEYETVKARHILIAFKGSPAAQKGKKELTEEEAKAKAESLRAKLVAGGDFAALAKAESDDTGSGANGGELGSFSHGQMVPEFEKAAFETKAGEISPVVRTQYGYHIIQVQEHKVTSLADVKASIEKKLRSEKLQAKLDEMKKDANPVYSEAYFTPAAAPKQMLRPNPAATDVEPGEKLDNAKKPAPTKKP